MKRVVTLSDPVLGSAEKEALAEVIDSGWITMGDRVDRFERDFAAAHESSDAIAVSSGTAALHLALAAVGVSQGDEVLVPSLTFVATANAAWYVGATPVLVDVAGIEKPHICISDARRKITERTKAVIVVHYGGWMCDMTEWRRFADEHRLWLIEDAAHVAGERKAGKQGDAAAFSFYGNKNMTTAEGGMIVSRHESISGRVRGLRSHAMTTLTLDRRAGHAFSYDVTGLGFNYRMDELRAAVGIVQLKRLNEWNQQRRRLLELYRDRILNSGCGVAMPFMDDDETTAHLCPVLLPEGVDREKVMKLLREKGVHSSVHYPAIHRFSYYVENVGRRELPNTEDFADRELSLPIHPRMNGEDVDHVVSALCGSL